ncbi:MAG: fumarylacetoacetate hydrolase family protein [Betaproteobacteria bacterium]|jgi:2-keto-4-pentenoate hydratase/2-oxohepta-3-ene-1,7-dioic acid hydratase in catechol pathway
MKLATFINPKQETVIGAIDISTQTVLDLQACHIDQHGSKADFLIDMLALMDSGDSGLNMAQSIEKSNAGTSSNRFKLDDVKLLSPVPVPRQIRDFNNAEGHMRNAPAGMAMLNAKLKGLPVPKRSEVDVVIPDVNFSQPIFYISNRFNVVGHDEKVEWPHYSQWFDYEGEFGFFIGKGGKNIKKEAARSHIFGYSIFNDFSARDKQMREMEGRMGPTKGKSFDTGNSIGPWIVTADEIKDTRSLAVEVRVNGEIWGKSSTSTMIHSFEEIIAYISDSETLYTGEFFGSGTIAGCCSLECDKWMKDKDVIEVEFEGLGVLRNQVLKQSKK